jgi:glucose/mannose-6-phosphate isomerase
MPLFDLDDLASYSKINRGNLREEMLSLPAQLQNAWDMGICYDLPAFDQVNNLVLTGLEGTAIGADILAAFVSDLSSIPVHVLRQPQLPLWVSGKNTLVIVFSPIGDNDEASSVIIQALQHNCSILVLSIGSEVSKLAMSHSIPVWKLASNSQPGSAVVFAFGILLAVMTRLNFIPEQKNAIQSALTAMERMIRSIDIGVPVKQNPAKRMAGQLLNRWVTVVGSDHLVPVAKYFKIQINERSKSWAQFECLSEIDHKTIVAIRTAEEFLPKTMVLFLSSSFMHPHNRLRMNHMRMELLRAGMNTDVVEFKEDSRLAEIWANVLFGDFLSYYLAVAYRVDPVPN